MGGIDRDKRQKISHTHIHEKKHDLKKQKLFVSYATMNLLDSMRSLSLQCISTKQTTVVAFRELAQYKKREPIEFTKRFHVKCECSLFANRCELGHIENTDLVGKKPNSPNNHNPSQCKLYPSLIQLFTIIIFSIFHFPLCNYNLCP